MRIGFFGHLEQPFHRLDVVFKQKLGRGFSLSLKAKNLIDHSVRFTQGGEMTEKYRLGRAFSIGLSKKW